MLKRLRDALTDAATLLEKGGAKSAADVKSVADLLGDADRPADVALDDLKAILDGEKSRFRISLVEKLKTAGDVKLAFEQELGAIDKNKAVSKDDMDAIAHLFTGGREKWPSRKAAVAAIRLRFVEMAYQDAKLRNAEKAKVW